MKSYYVYIGQSFHFGEKTAYTVGFSTNLTRRCYTKHMHLLNVYPFFTKSDALKAEKQTIKHLKDLGFDLAFVKFGNWEMPTKPNRTDTWFFVPEHSVQNFLYESNSLLAGLQTGYNGLTQIVGRRNNEKIHKKRKRNSNSQTAKRKEELQK